MATDETSKPRDFIREIVANDVAAGTNDGRVQTRFPPNRTATCTSAMRSRSA